MTTTANAENLRQCKSRLSLIVEQVLAFATSSDAVREEEFLSKFQATCITMFYIIHNSHSDR